MLEDRTGQVVRRARQPLIAKPTLHVPTAALITGGDPQVPVPGAEGAPWWSPGSHASAASSGDSRCGRAEGLGNVGVLEDLVRYQPAECQGEAGEVEAGEVWEPRAASSASGGKVGETSMMILEGSRPRSNS